MDQTPTDAANPTEPWPALTYDGKISEPARHLSLNLLLTIVTLGIFYFWAITRIRRYLWSHMRFAGTRFSYTGRGRELFFGFLLAILILMLAFAGVAIVSVALARQHPGLAAIPIGLAYGGLFVLFGAARFSAQRYRLSRTEWRGIRGGMVGSALRYGLNWLLYGLLLGVTLYQALPWMQVGLARWRINASRFGSAEFQCDSRARHLYPAWLATGGLPRAARRDRGGGRGVGVGATGAGVFRRGQRAGGGDRDPPRDAGADRRRRGVRRARRSADDMVLREAAAFDPRPDQSPHSRDAGAWDVRFWGVRSRNAHPWNAHSWNAHSWNAHPWNAHSWNAHSWNARFRGHWGPIRCGSAVR